MKVLVTGSRTWTDRKIIHAALKELPEGSIIVNGGNGRYDRTTRTWYGADILSTQFGLVHSYEIREYPVTDADWRREGLKAGFLRNRTMLEAEHPDYVYAFRMEDKSNGTDNMMRLAIQAEVPLELHYLTSQGVIVAFPESVKHLAVILDTKSSQLL